MAAKSARSGRTRAGRGVRSKGEVHEVAASGSVGSAVVAAVSSKKGGSGSAGSASAAQKAFAELPAVRIKTADSSKQQIPFCAITGLNKKPCAFLCGSICAETPDPCDPDRRSIRWQNDKVSLGAD